uniref:Protein kinase n=1 Tax=Marseillevirus LCMAC102 TaxID=2506603 RepID=A0A481YUJ8_9VIRU|nr:MAG: protein kinase [Marseillevirus LCMAC102]
MTTKIQFQFQGRKEALDIVDTGGELVAYLANEDVICPLIGSKIKLVKELGKGAFGTAFLIKIKGMGPKEYVAKRTKGLVKTGSIGHNLPLEKVANWLSKKIMTNSQTIINLNGGDPEKIIGARDKIYIPGYSTICRTDKLEDYERFDADGATVIQPGSYLCDDEQYSEYVIGVLAGNLYRNHISINFLDVFGFASCITTKKVKPKVFQYVFMDKIDAELSKMDPNIFDKISASFLIQIIHAIATYQHYYKLVHNDLHPGNVFVEYVTPNTKFNGQPLYDADWYHYHIFGSDIYMPATPYIAKIGDFGLSVKWSSTLVGSKESVTTGFDQLDGNGPWIPNWYAESYDMLFITRQFYAINSGSIFIQRLFSKMLGLDTVDRPNLDKAVIKFFTSGNRRPKMEYLETLALQGATPKAILTNKKLLEKCFNKPSSGKIVTLGTLN